MIPADQNPHRGSDQTGQRANRPLHLAVVTETYPPEINGVANTLFHMVEGLAERDHRVMLLRPAKARSERESHEHGGVLEIPTSGMPLPFYQGLQVGLPASRVMSKAFRDARPDLLYIATEGPLGISAQRVARRLRIPLVAGFHTNFQTYSKHYGVGLFAPAVLAYLRRFHNRCDATLVPTRALAEELSARQFQRLSVWPRGVDTALFSPARRNRERRTSWGLDDDGLAVVYVGRVAPEKNIGLAINAFNAIRERSSQARLVLVGDGPELASLRRSFPDFVFTGARTGTDLAEHYASGDLFLFPSLSETFGNVVTEAMSSGLPVVAFNLAAAREHIRDGFNGMNADAGNETDFIRQATRAATDPALREELGRKARETALELGWPKMIMHLEQVFLETLKTSGRNGAHENMVAAAE
ncbi:MAG: glycosyltransferase family 1 protein [Pseudomonadota bacterium]